MEKYDLAAAIRLYETVGFQLTRLDELGLKNYYARADVLMKLDLANVLLQMRPATGIFLA